MAETQGFSFDGFLESDDDGSLSADVEDVMASKRLRDNKQEEKIAKEARTRAANAQAKKSASAQSSARVGNGASRTTPKGNRVASGQQQGEQQQNFVPLFTPIHVMTDEELQARHDAREREMLKRREERRLQREAERKAEEERLADPKRWTPEERYRARKASVEKACPVIAASIHNYFIDCPYDASVVGNAVNDLRNDDLPTNFNIYSEEYREWTHTVKFAKWCDEHNVGYNPERINWGDDPQPSSQPLDPTKFDANSLDFNNASTNDRKKWTDSIKKLFGW